MYFGSYPSPAFCCEPESGASRAVLIVIPAKAPDRRAREVFPIVIPAKAGIQRLWVAAESVGRTPLGPRFRGDDNNRYLALLKARDLGREDPASLAAALRLLEQGLDFADALHICSSAHAERLVTFDAKLVKRARRASTLEVAVA